MARPALSVNRACNWSLMIFLCLGLECKCGDWTGLERRPNIYSCTQSTVLQLIYTSYVQCTLCIVHTCTVSSLHGITLHQTFRKVGYSARNHKSCCQNHKVAMRSASWFGMPGNASPSAKVAAIMTATFPLFENMLYMFDIVHTDTMHCLYSLTIGVSTQICSVPYFEYASQ